jgi:putative DNA primase/helicase
MAIDAIKFAERVKGARRSGTAWQGLCPAHDDSNASLTWTDGEKGLVVKCHRGCESEAVLHAVGLKFSDLFRESEPKHRARLTVEALAASKSLSVPFLADLGVKQQGSAVKITYRRPDGAEAVRQRLRTSCIAKDGSKWLGRKGGELEPYGAWRLSEARTAGFLLLVEGESDCWSAWFHRFPVLGIPGAHAVKVMRKEHLEGIPKVYVLREPDDGGGDFVRGVQNRLRKLQYTGTVSVITMPDGLKDLNDLHKDDAERFDVRLRDAISRAHLITTVDVGEHAFALTDLGNAERLVARFGGNFRYVPGAGLFVWDGKRWVLDEANCEVLDLAGRAVREMYGEAEHLDHDDARRELVQWARMSESRARLESMTALAKTKAKGRLADFDQDRCLLNVLNGTLDLKTGHLRPHRSGDFITKLAPVAYDANAVAPTWDRFVMEIMQGNADMVAFLQRVVGYALSGETSEQVFFILFGSGANGKTTFVRTIGDMLGDYAAHTETETLMVKAGGRPSNDVARLRGARFVTATEIAEGRWLDEPRMKQMTGGDRITARLLYHEHFEFVSEFKLLLSVNHKPRIRGTDHSIWRRVRVIPFPVIFTEPDPSLLDRLRHEASGILTWAVKGFTDWRAQGLAAPAEVVNATRDYRAEEDVFSRFIAERCYSQSSAYVGSSVLYRAYLDWCEQNAEVALTQHAVARRLNERGHKSKKSNGTIRWPGLGVRGEVGEDGERDSIIRKGSGHRAETHKRAPRDPLPPHVAAHDGDGARGGER